MVSDNKHIALISVHGDPAVAIGQEEAGGQNVYVRQIGEALSHHGWQVEMFTRRSDAQQPPVVEHNEHCRTIRLTAGPEQFVPRDEIFDYLPAFVEQLQKFQQQEGFEYRLVHTNYWLSAWVGMELKRRQSLKQVHTHHSLGAVKYTAVDSIPPIAQTRLDTEKTCIETAERVIATSPQEREDMRSLVTTQGDIDVIPCGTDVQWYGSVSKPEARQRLGLDPDTRTIFYVGRFDTRKGIETLVRAVGRSKLRGQMPLSLIIAGGSRSGHKDADERDRIRSIVRELGIEEFTSFPGRLKDEDMPVHFAAADVCVVPSHYEPFGLVAIEAMASGTPVVASEVGGLKYTVVPEQTGLLAPPKDEAAFAEAIDRILSDPAWRDELGRNARARVEQEFSWDGVAAQLSELYTALLEEREPDNPQALGELSV
jgi:glycosyltransferase involved in cell wall biosynthesis